MKFAAERRQGRRGRWSLKTEQRVGRPLRGVRKYSIEMEASREELGKLYQFGWRV